MAYSQSEERTIFSTRKKELYVQPESRTMFFTSEKSDTSNQKPQNFVSFAPKFPPFLGALQHEAPSLCELLRRHAKRKDHKSQFLL